MLIAIVIVVAVLLLLPKKGSKFPSMPSLSEPVATVLPQRDADRKEALELIEAKLIEADKQTRFAEAVTVISGLSDFAEAVTVISGLSDPAKKVAK